MARLPYDVAVFLELKPLLLTQAERVALRNALKKLNKSPSDTFINAYAKALGWYVAHSKEVGVLGPGQVSNRLKTVLDRGHALLTAVDGLRDADRCYISRFWARKFLANEDAASENQFLKSLGLFLGDVQSACHELEKTQRKGRMPAYSAQALALEIANALFLETGKFPPVTRDRLFDNVLRCAIDAGERRIGRIDGAGRRDVMALMRSAKKNFSEEGAKQFGEALR